MTDPGGNEFCVLRSLAEKENELTGAPSPGCHSDAVEGNEDA